MAIFSKKVDAQKYIRNVKLKKQSCCSTSEKPIQPKKLPWSLKIAIALRAGWDTLRPIIWYLIIGVALGAMIYGYMPSDWVLKIAGPDNPFAISVAAIIGHKHTRGWIF